MIDLGEITMNFSSMPNRGLCKRLRREARISVCVFDHEAIHGYVLINAVAEQSEDPGDRYSLAMRDRYPRPELSPHQHHSFHHHLKHHNPVCATAPRLKESP